jgi:Flp pilus assembly protein TadG
MLSVPTAIERACLTMRQFFADRGGATSTIFALSTTAVMFSVGAAVDYSRAVTSRAKLQSAVDSAVLAAIQAPAAERVSRATSILQANLAASGITANWSTAPTLNADGSISAIAAGSITTAALAVAGINTINLAASATAKIVQKTVQSPANMTFTLTGASGWYWKKVDLYKHEPNAASDTLLASYVYQPTSLNNGGTGTVTAQFLTAGAMASGPVDTTVPLGSTYDNAYLTMTVYSDGCGPGYGPQHSDFASNSSYWNPFACMAVGSTWTSTSTVWNSYQRKYVTTTTTNTVAKTTAPVVYSTGDASTAHNLFVNGVELPNGAAPNFFSLFACGGTTTHDWEDTPWANPLPGSWSQQDIHFTVTSTCAANANIAQSSTPALTQ